MPERCLARWGKMLPNPELNNTNPSAASPSLPNISFELPWTIQVACLKPALSHNLLLMLRMLV